MRGFIVSAGCLMLGCIPAAFSQEGPTKFEVASVRQSNAPSVTPAYSSMKGGPGTADPERITYTNTPLKTLMLKAYQVLNYQLSGPDWLDSGRYDILAKVPPGATEQQFNAMLRNLLEERFNLTFHHESKEMSVYELTVEKNGLKLKDADLTPLPERDPGSGPLRIGDPDKAGFPQVPSLGRPMLLGRMTDGIMRWTGRTVSLSDLVAFLGRELDRPVLDKTGLTGKYDFTLAHSRDGLRPRPLQPGVNAPPIDDTPSGGPTLQKAVQDQLGLKLESAKDPIDILVIDHIDKVPTDN